MERNKKTSLIYMICAATLLAFLGAFFMFIALSKDFSPSLGYFEKGSLSAILLYAVLACGVLLGFFSWIFFRSSKQITVRNAATVYTKTAEGFLIAALLWCTGEDLVHIHRTLPYWGLILFADLLALFFILFLGCSIGPESLRSGPLAAFSSFFPPLYAVTQLFLLYFDETVATNSPIKIIYQLMYIAFMLAFTAQTGLLLGHKSILPRYIFALICSAVLGGIVSVSALLCILTNTPGHNLSYARILFCCTVTVYAFCRLLSFALTKDLPSENTKEETA